MRIFNLSIFIGFVLLLSCTKSGTETASDSAVNLAKVAAVQLNYRFEPDVPPPTQEENLTNELHPAVQADFSANRLDDILVKTVISPDKQRILTVYRRSSDTEFEFRIDMYSADGKIIRKISYDAMAVHYPDTIVWSPDSKNVAFTAKVRGAVLPTPLPASAEANLQTKTNAANANTNANLTSEREATENTNVSANQTPFVEPAKAVLTMRTEQLYICGADGEDVKLLTQKEGLIYYYFVWSPDSTMIVALASTFQEWQIMQFKAKQDGLFFVPSGRPRLIEKNGRERLLDDNPTNVYPVWSPDSTKVAVSYDKTIKIYDVLGTQPTQAAVPLENPLLLSSKAYKEKVQSQNQNIEANQNQNTNGNTAQTNVETNANIVVSTEIDDVSRVYFNPIIELKWIDPSILYLQTGYQKLFENSANNVRSYLRWHRLIFSPQAIPAANQR